MARPLDSRTEVEKGEGEKPTCPPQVLAALDGYGREGLLHLFNLDLIKGNCIAPRSTLMRAVVKP